MEDATLSGLLLCDKFGSNYLTLIR